MVRALVVDDHPLIQEAIGNVLRRVEPTLAVESAASCEGALELAGQGSEPDLVVLDLNLPGLSGIQAVKAWRARYPGVPIVVISATTDPATMLAAIGAGAAGFIPKSSSHEVMQSALRLVLAGEKYLPAKILSGSGHEIAGRRRLSIETLGLTARQAEVLKLIANGASNKVISRELGLAERTVKAHITAVFRALNVTSRTQAALQAAKLGLVDSRTTGGR